MSYNITINFSKGDIILKKKFRLNLVISLASVLAIILILIIWYYTSFVLPVKFAGTDVVKVTVSGGNRSEAIEIKDRKTLKEIKALYDKIRVDEKIDTYEGHPCTPDNVMDIELKNGDIIAIQDFGYLFIQTSHTNETGEYDSDRYGYICSQDTLIEFIRTIGR